MAEAKRKSTAEAGPPAKKFKSNKNGVHPDRERLQYTKDGVLGTNSSKEAHQQQRALRAERLAAKPNADSIARSKKIWERLRIKSAVDKDERKKLVTELFAIITGRVKEFVFKHDSVRVIQCAIKYASPEQKAQIAQELRGTYRELAESRYAKFLVAKLIVSGEGVRDIVVPEFYGHVKRLVRHPEAGWIVDDIYRGMATKEQKARLLREWYGGEFAVAQLSGDNATAELSEILKESPGKKGPIMQHLKEMTNQLVQKKTTGFTMLHDALLQYLLNCTPGTAEHTEFLEMLRDDEEGDLFKNLAFTKSGSRIVCLALAYGTSKDRRTILKHYKTHVKLMAGDANAHHVLLAAYEVIDDTVMSAKAIMPELLSKDLDAETREQDLLRLSTHICARVPLLFLMAEEPPKWLLDASAVEMLKDIREIRKETSKKDPSTRRLELNKALSQGLLDFCASQTWALLQSSFGCQFLAEVLIGAIGEKDAAMDALAALAVKEDLVEVLATPHAGRLYKALVQGGRFDSKTKAVIPADPALGFADKLFKVLQQQEQLLNWATGPNSWSIVAMLESEFEHKDELIVHLKKQQAELEAPKDHKALNSGTKVLLEKIGGGITVVNSADVAAPVKPAKKDKKLKVFKAEKSNEDNPKKEKKEKKDKKAST